MKRIFRNRTLCPSCQNYIIILGVGIGFIHTWVARTGLLKVGTTKFSKFQKFKEPIHEISLFFIETIAETEFMYHLAPDFCLNNHLRITNTTITLHQISIFNTHARCSKHLIARVTVHTPGQQVFRAGRQQCRAGTQL